MAVRVRLKTSSEEDGMSNHLKSNRTMRDADSRCPVKAVLS